MHNKTSYVPTWDSLASEITITLSKKQESYCEKRYNLLMKKYSHGEFQTLDEKIKVHMFIWICIPEICRHTISSLYHSYKCLGYIYINVDKNLSNYMEKNHDKMLKEILQLEGDDYGQDNRNQG